MCLRLKFPLKSARDPHKMSLHYRDGCPKLNVSFENICCFWKFPVVDQSNPRILDIPLPDCSDLFNPYQNLPDIGSLRLPSIPVSTLFFIFCNKTSFTNKNTVNLTLEIIFRITSISFLLYSCAGLVHSSKISNFGSLATPTQFLPTRELRSRLS